MSVLCIIPARGGSKGILRKNLRRVGGRTLIGRAIDAALGSVRVDSVLVSTDDDDIAAVAETCGASVVRRPDELGTDAASSESVLVQAIGQRRAETGEVPDVLVFLQCTSPFIRPGDIDRAVDMVSSGEYDSVFSATSSHAFLWHEDDGSVVGINHDWRSRQRRQDRPVEYRETGAIYVMRTRGFLETGHRFFGRIGLCEVPGDHGIEIDDEHDLALARSMVERISADPLERLEIGRVAALVTDFDGVHTDNLAMVDEHGTESVVVNRSDGLGLSALRKTGLPVLILSTEQNPVVAARARKLGIECIHGSDDKLESLRTWAAQHGIRPAEIVYVGNDANDLGCLGFVGWPVVVADAHPSVRESGAMVTAHRGGAGAIREVTDRLLKGVAV